jgi:glucose-1-phosphate cytidylyltransferase
MKYYAHHGHREFILCLGYGADVIKNYFLNYSECVSNDFVLSNGGKHLELFGSDIDEWQITFADTGTDANIGQRLRAVQKYLGNDDVFLANYSDGLTDLPMPKQLEHFHAHDRIASFACVRPNLSYHFVSVEDDGVVTDIKDVSQSDIRINGGYFILKHDIFKFMKGNEELLNEPFQRLVTDRQVVAYKYDGFWATMDTFKDKQLLDDMYARGHAPWEIWKLYPPGAERREGWAR